MAKQDLTAHQLRELLQYNADTGLFTWLERVDGRVKAGSVAGYKSGVGYLQVCVLGRQYLAHRLAWFYFYSHWPKGQIDHISGDRSNNSIKNLRDVSRRVNSQNQRRAMSNNICGLLGVSPSRGRWQAQIVLDGKVTHIGRFDTPEEAHAAYLGKKRLMHAGCTI